MLSDTRTTLTYFAADLGACVVITSACINISNSVLSELDLSFAKAAAENYGLVLSTEVSTCI